MKRAGWLPIVFAKFLIALAALGSSSVQAADTLNWNTNNNQVTADITSVPLIRLLEGISQLTGWHVYVESNATRNISVKFKDLPAGEALRSLLGNLNFALVPQTNSRSRLYVFQSSLKNATILLKPGSLESKTNSANAIPDELIITLKRGVKPNEVDCLQNAEILGQIDGMNAYRVKFQDETAARSARLCLASDSNVKSVDSNFDIAKPIFAQALGSDASADINLNLKKPDGNCGVIVAFVDTPMGSPNKNLEKFFLPGISVMDNQSQSTVPSSELTHGQAMAQTILRAIQNTTSGNTSVKLLPVDVYGSGTTTTTFHVTQGVYRAVNSGANIVNMSLGSSGDSTILHNLIKQAKDQGVVFFGAAGNEPVTTPTFPAAYPEVVAVTAGDAPGQVSSYANRGSFVDIMTPGASIVSFNGQSYMVNGTSSATAYASGMAAGLADSNHECPPGVLPAIQSKLGVNFSNDQ